MPPTPSIPRDALPSIIAALDAAKPPQVSYREAVNEMSSSIRAARARGCTDRVILDILATHGIKISASTLRAYMSGKASKTKPPRKDAAVAAAAALSDVAPADR